MEVAAAPIVVDGPPVTVSLQAGQIEQLTFAWHGETRIALRITACETMAVGFDQGGDNSSRWSCGRGWQGEQRNGPYELYQLGTYTLVLQVAGTTFPSGSMTIEVDSAPPDATGTIAVDLVVRASRSATGQRRTMPWA